jgi:hypothetical protein
MCVKSFSVGIKEMRTGAIYFYAGARSVGTVAINVLPGAI